MIEAIESARPTQRRAHHAFWPKRIPTRIDAPAGSLWNNLATSALRYPNKDLQLWNW